MRVIKTHCIKLIRAIEPAPKGENALLQLPAVDIESVEKRELSNIAKAQAEDKKLNVNVAPKVQALFDALSKQYDMIWKGENMYLTDLEVTIAPPYQPSHCSGNVPDAALDRVRKVVRGMLEKLASKDR